MKKPHKYPKQDNPVAKQRELKASWEEILKKHAKPLFSRPTKIIKLSSPKKPSTVISRKMDVTINTNPNSMMGVAAKVAPKVYTGDNIIGISVMHKSSLVPVFSKEEAQDLAKMRR